MKDFVRTFFHYLRRVYVICIKSISLLWPKDKKLIIFSSWFGMKYADNSMYLFEYMLNNSSYRVVWYTRNREVYHKLLSEGKPVIYKNTLKAIFYHLRAKVFISTVQFNDFISELMSNCILLDLDHGFPAKYVHFVSPTITKREIEFEYILRKWVSYYMTASSKFTMEVVSKCFALPSDRLVFCNKPRIDVFYDKKLRKGNNQQIDQLKDNKYKAIVWMPTHRSDGNVNIDVAELLDLKNIQEICEKHNAVFLIKKHYYHRNERSDLDNYSRIYDITNEEIETQTLLYQADVLISDYSSCYIEYLTMNRPIILYVYDLDNYLKNERGVCVRMEDNHVGYKVKSKEELNNCLRIIGNDWTDSRNQEGRNEAIERYFDKKVEMGGSCKRITELLPSIIDGSYRPQWN